MAMSTGTSEDETYLLLGYDSNMGSVTRKQSSVFDLQTIHLWCPFGHLPVCTFGAYGIGMNCRWNKWMVWRCVMPFGPSREK